MAGLLFTTMWQPCYNLVINLFLTRPCHKVVIRLLQGYEKVKLNSSYGIANFSGQWFQDVDICIHTHSIFSLCTLHVYRSICTHLSCQCTNTILHLPTSPTITFIFNLVYITSHLSISIHCGVNFIQWHSQTRAYMSLCPTINFPGPTSPAQQESRDSIKN